MAPRFTSLAEWLAWQETLHPKAIDLGLDRIRRVLARLGWNSPSCPVITVGGTNGKGSSVALLDSILSAAGYRVGTFTSPHLSRYSERIRVEGREVSDASLVAAFERIDAARQDDSLTFFEFNTLAALLVFETAGLDAMVLEVGLGGRLDAVNVVDADVALLTSVALDHCEWLGADVEAIGREKAGIFREGRPAVFAARDLPHSVVEVAEEIGARLDRLGSEFDYRIADKSWDWIGSTRIEALPPPALTGAVQYANAAGVIAVLGSLADRLPVPREAIATGLRAAYLPGRFEVRPGAVTWIFDVAHNPAAARNLARNLAGLPIAGRTLAVCGVLADKDIEAIVDELRLSFDEWVLALLAGPRAGTPEALKARFARAGIRASRIEGNVDAACAAAKRMASPGDRIVVFGSFLTVGPARDWQAARF